MIEINRSKDTGDQDTTPLIPEGRHLVRITSVSDEDSDYLLVAYRVVASRARAAVGMTGSERFYLSEKAIWRLSMLFKRAGLQDRGEPADEAAAYDEQELVGQQLVVDVEHEVGKVRTYAKWAGGGFWPESHKDVAEFVASLSRQRGPAKTQRTAAPAQRRVATNEEMRAPVTQDDEV